jgi:hypothetical protein
VVRNLILFAAIVATFYFVALSYAGDREQTGRSRIKTIRFDDLQLSITEKPGNEGYLLQFIRDGRVVFTGECAFRVHEPKIIADVPLPNSKSLLAYCFSGGAHCCMTLFIATNCNSWKTLTAVDLAHSADEVKFVNANGRTSRQIKLVDWQLAYYGPEDSRLQLPFSESPGMDRLLVFDDGKWRVDRVGEFSRYYVNLLGKSRKAALSAAGKKKDEDRAAAKALEAAYYSLMSGRSVEDARDVLDSLLPPSWKPEAARIIEDIRQAVTEYNPVEEIQ